MFLLAGSRPDGGRSAGLAATGGLTPVATPVLVSPCLAPLAFSVPVFVSLQAAFGWSAAIAERQKMFKSLSLVSHQYRSGLEAFDQVRPDKSWPDNSRIEGLISSYYQGGHFSIKHTYTKVSGNRVQLSCRVISGQVGWDELEPGWRRRMPHGMTAFRRE